MCLHSAGDQLRQLVSLGSSSSSCLGYVIRHSKYIKLEERLHCCLHGAIGIGPYSPDPIEKELQGGAALLPEQRGVA